MNVEPSLASVLGARLGKDQHDRFVQWRARRVQSDPIAELHTKFWGKSADEEKEWRNAQPPSLTGDLEDEGHDRDDKMDRDGDGDGDGDAGMVQGMVQGDGSDKDDDVIPGCYMLDIGIEGLEFSKMWIRAEYIRIFDYIQAFFKKPGIPPGRPPCAVITGQPGIGVFSLVISSI